MTYASVLWVPGYSDKVYPDREAYMDEVIELMKQIVGECVEAGCDYFQLDSPRYTHLVSEEGQENLRNLGLDTETWLGQMIERDNQLIRAFPDVTWAVHLCRGNHRSMWSVEGGYDAIAEQLFNDAGVRSDLRRVRLAAGRHIRAAPLRAGGQDRRARADHDQGARARGRRSAQGSGSRRPRSTSRSSGWR